MYSIKKQVLRIGSILMLAVFLYGITPREFLHQTFAHHHDTIEPVLKKGEIAFGNKHVHCSFLSIDFGVFVFAEQQVLFFARLIHTEKYVLSDYNYYYASYRSLFCLRGPPQHLFS